MESTDKSVSRRGTERKAALRRWKRQRHTAKQRSQSRQQWAYLQTGKFILESGRAFPLKQGKARLKKICDKWRCEGRGGRKHGRRAREQGGGKRWLKNERCSSKHKGPSSNWLQDSYVARSDSLGGRLLRAEDVGQCYTGTAKTTRQGSLPCHIEYKTGRSHWKDQEREETQKFITSTESRPTNS